MYKCEAESRTGSLQLGNKTTSPPLHAAAASTSSKVLITMVTPTNFSISGPEQPDWLLCLCMSISVIVASIQNMESLTTSVCSKLMVEIILGEDMGV